MITPSTGNFKGLDSTGFTSHTSGMTTATPTPNPDYDGSAQIWFSISADQQTHWERMHREKWNRAIDTACAPLLAHIEVQRQAFAEIARLLARRGDAVRASAAWQLANGMTEPRKDDDL